MKKLISVIILTFVFCYSGQAAREISSFEIARWYLDADLVLICNVRETNTFTIAKYDSLVADGFHYRYDIVREKYHISVDSVIKGGQYFNESMDSIYTPDFSTSSWMEKTEFTGIDSNGDSIFIHSMKANSSYNDNSYFTIKSPEKRLVILRKTEIGYVIDYQTACDSITLNFIQEVKTQGEDYFNFLSAETVKSENVHLFPNPFKDVITIKGSEAKEIEITDLNGKTNKIEIRDPHSIDLSYLKPGIYVISIFTENKKWTKKMVKE